MLNRTASTSTWAPGHWSTWHRELPAGPISALLRYALTLLALCLVGCLYFLQANQLARLNEATLRLERQAAQLERHNLNLKLQLAQWNSPAYVRGEALKQNYVRDPSILYVNVAGVGDETASMPPPLTQTAQAR